MIVIEHNLDVMKQADYIIDLRSYFKYYNRKRYCDEQRDNLIGFYSNDIVLRIANVNTCP